MRRATCSLFSTIAKMGFKKYLSHGSSVARRRYSRRLMAEVLEDRAMLTVIGFFERDGGSVFSKISGNTTATGGEDQFIREQGGSSDDTRGDAASLISAGPTALATAQAVMSGRISTSIGEDSAAPFVIGNGLIQVFSEGDTSADWASGFMSLIYQALSDYQFHEEPAIAEDLVFHGHLAIAGGMEQLIAGDGLVDSAAHVLAEIRNSNSAGYRLVATRLGDSVWTWSRIDPANNIVDEGSSTPDGLAQHWHFTVPIQDLDQKQFLVQTGDINGWSRPEIPHDNWSASHFGTTAAAAWGYVTRIGEDVPVGDFNFDWVVDEQDFAIWEQGLPQADANEDGRVDELDYEKWYENTSTIVVSTLIDELDSDDSYGDLSLREALAIAASKTGDDVISFAPSLFSTGPSSMILTYDGTDAGTAADHLIVNSSLSIVGPGQELLTLDGNAQNRLFWVQSGHTAEISGMSMVNGSPGVTSGGAVFNSGDLTLDGVTIANNIVAINGGGIYSNGTIRIMNSTIADNTATGVAGGVYIQSDATVNAVIENTAIINNSASHVGGIRFDDVSNISGPSAVMTNTTVSGNSSTGDTGGIQVTPLFTLTVRNSTITNNTAAGVGGGIRTSGSNTTFHNTILAGNTASTAWTSDYADNSLNSASSHNLIGINGTSNLTNGVNGNIVGTTTAPRDPGLAPLGNYGGPTQTHALAYGSLAIDAGDPAAIAGQGGVPLFDQRGQGFSRVLDGNTVPGARLDIGAFESGNDNRLFVRIVDDESDGNYSPNDLSLREAILLASATSGPDVIAFSPTLFVDDPAQRTEIILNSPLVVGTSTASRYGNLTIDGSAINDLTINGNSAIADLFDFQYGDDDILIQDLRLTGALQQAITKSLPYSSMDVTLERMRIIGNGGTGVTYSYNGSLTIRDSEISNNGGGVAILYGNALTISNSTIAENSGTAVAVSFAGANLYNTTISGNETDGSVAGLAVAWGSATLTNVTVANNRADASNTSGVSSATGGIYAGTAAWVTLHNSIVVGNFAGDSSNGIAADLGRVVSPPYSGEFNSSSSYNLVGSSPSGAFPVGQVGFSVAAVGLTELDNYGGLTRTHTLIENSIAIDAGDNAKAIALGLEYDQRGLDRIVDWLEDDLQATVDIGAVELAVVELY